LGKVFEQTFTNNIQILRGHLEPDATATDLVEKRVFAFAGIGRPKKFFDTLKNIGCVITGTLEFDDHHTYTVDEIKNLVQKADEMNATLITTSKDCCRIDRNLAPGIIELPISLHWENQSILDKMLEPILSTIE